MANDEHTDDSLTGNKIGAMFTLLAVGCFGAVIPFMFKRCNSASKVGRLLNSFGGGAFVGLALFHLLPEALTLLDEAKIGISVAGSFYNLTFLLCTVGLFAMIFLEKVLWIPGMGDASIHSHSCGGALVQNPCYDIEKPESGIQATVEDNQQRPKALSCAILAVAISVHSFFEGGVVGVALSPALVWLSTGAIVAHKWMEGFALSNTWIKNRETKTRTIMYIVIFVIASPLGTLFGLLLSDNVATANAVGGVFNAFAVGMIVYIGMEVLNDCLSGATRWEKVLMFIVGISGAFLVFGMFLLHLQYHGHGVDDDDDHCHDHAH